MLSFLRKLTLLALALLAFAPADGWASAERAAKAPAAARPAAKARPPLVRSPSAPRPAIWLLADEDTRIYMLGTVHVLPPGFRWRSPAIDRIIASADELIIETYEQPGKASHRAARESVMLPAPVPILARVPAERRAALKAAIGAGSLPLAFYDRMQTWAAGMTIGMAQLLGSYGADDSRDAPGVEAVLEAAFRAAGKPIGSVEDPGEVVASLNALPEKVQAGLLLDAIAPSKIDGKSAAHEDFLWATGEVEAMNASFLRAFPPALVEPLLVRRNRAWSKWLERRLQRPGTILFAVGAAHLAGDVSVQHMLAERGLQVTRVE